MNNKTNVSDDTFELIFSIATIVAFLIIFWLVMINQVIFHLALTSFFGIVFLIASGSGCLFWQFANRQHYKSRKYNNSTTKLILATINVISFIVIIFCCMTFNNKVETLRKAEKLIIKQETVIYSIQELEVEENYNSSAPRKIKVTYLDKNNNSQTVTIEGGEISNLNSYRGEKPKIQIDKRYISDEDVKKYNVDSFDVERINKTKYKIIQRTLFDK